MKYSGDTPYLLYYNTRYPWKPPLIDRVCRINSPKEKDVGFIRTFFSHTLFRLLLRIDVKGSLHSQERKVFGPHSMYVPGEKQVLK